MCSASVVCPVGLFVMLMYALRALNLRLGALEGSIRIVVQHKWWLVECCFTSTETVGLLGTGAQDGHLNFHTAPKLSNTSEFLF